MEKRCTECKKIKSLKEFSKNKNAQDGYQHRCKICAKAYAQSEKGKQSQNQYNQSEKARQKNEQYAQSNKGKRTRKRYAQSGQGKRAAKKVRATRRTLKTQAGGSYTIDEWFNLCKFYNFHCLKCNKQFLFEKLAIDHIKPVSKGGSSFIWNLQPLCMKCNRHKADKEIDYRQTLPDWIDRDGPIWMQGNLL